VARRKRKNGELTEAQMVRLAEHLIAKWSVCPMCGERAWSARHWTLITLGDEETSEIVYPATIVTCRTCAFGAFINLRTASVITDEDELE
jgi:hypothetical protein